MMLGLRAAAAVAAGLLLSMLVAPWGLYGGAWLAHLPFFWALREGSRRQNLALTLLYATVAEAAIFGWIAPTITLFSNIPGPLAWGVNGLFAVVYGVPLFLGFAPLLWMRRRFGTAWVLLLPAWMVVVEYLASWVILFPWNLGVSQFQFLSLWQLASVTGVWGLTFVVLSFNCVVGEALYRRREGRPLPGRELASALTVVSLITAWGTTRFAAVEAELAVAPVKRVVQLQSKETMTYRMSHPAREAYDFWVAETQKIPRGAADLVVWPEGSSPYSLNGSTATFQLWDLTEQGDFDLIVGGGTRERDADPEMGERGRVRIFNSVYFFGRDQRGGGGRASLRREWTALVAGGCDLDAAHVFTPVEARVFAEVAHAEAGGRVSPPVASLLGGQGLQLDVEPTGASAVCVAKLRARESVLRAAMKVDAAFEDALLVDDDAWSDLRVQTARFTAPLAEAQFRPRKTLSYWIAVDSACTDGDCAAVAAQCVPGSGCEVYPSPPHFDKMVPLPFGEYLPLADTFPWLADIIRGPGNFRAGTEAVVFEASGTRVATPICYEGILNRVCTAFERPDLLANVTNDAWFGDTAASDLHGMLVAIRAVELGIPVFRSAYAGVSMVIEPHGRIYAKTPLFEVVNRVVPVRIARVPTLYARWGDWFVWLCALALLVASAARRR